MSTKTALSPNMAKSEFSVLSFFHLSNDKRSSSTELVAKDEKQVWKKVSSSDWDDKLLLVANLSENRIKIVHSEAKDIALIESKIDKNLKLHVYKKNVEFLSERQQKLRVVFKHESDAEEFARKMSIHVDVRRLTNSDHQNSCVKKPLTTSTYALSTYASLTITEDLDVAEMSVDFDCSNCGPLNLCIEMKIMTVKTWIQTDASIKDEVALVVNLTHKRFDVIDPRFGVTPRLTFAFSDQLHVSRKTRTVLFEIPPNGSCWKIKVRFINETLANSFFDSVGEFVNIKRRKESDKTTVSQTHSQTQSFESRNLNVPSSDITKPADLRRQSSFLTQLDDTLFNQLVNCVLNDPTFPTFAREVRRRNKRTGGQ